MHRSHVVIALAWMGLVLGCGRTPENLPICTAANSPNSICGVMNPEDLDFLPGRAWIVVSQMAPAEAGALPARPGNLLAIRLADGRRQTLFPAPDGWPQAAGTPGASGGFWGDSDCAEPPEASRFLPHGIAVGRHASGAPLLAVVGHGEREAVEFFEIVSGQHPSLVWRGCVRMPEGMMANDLALFADGGFVVTKFMAPIEGMGPALIWSGFRVMMGWNTGAVYRWTPGGELAPVENSAGSALNGIAISADQTEIFVSEWGEARIYRLRLDVEGEPVRASVALEHRPDNLTWTRDGRLLAAGQGGGLRAILACGEIEKGGCGLDYGIYIVDPVSLEATLLFTGEGAASVALEVGDEIYVGTFSGDQIERVAKPD